MTKTINPTPFDLAVIDVVETLSHNLHKIDSDIVHVNSKKEILDLLEINHLQWPDIRNNKRHVSTKSDTQSRIIHRLQTKFDVDPRFIYQYPHHKSMFARNIMAGTSFAIPGSAKVLQRIVGDLKTQVEKLENELIKKQDEIELLQDILETQRQLIKTLTPGQKAGQ